MAQIQFLKDAPVGGLGYKLKVSAGETAKFIHSRGLGIKDGQAPADTEAFDLTEAFLQYRFLFDWVGTFKPMKKLGFILNTDYGTEEQDPNAGGADSMWAGVAGIVKYDFNLQAALQILISFSPVS